MKSPADMGLPPKFKKWRPVQEAAINHWLPDRRFTIQATPTGIGKSLIYMTGALQRCERTTILTSTKGLQDQLVQDFSGIGLVEVRGRSNYPCVRGDGPTADEGWCHLGQKCDFRSGGCAYFDALNRAMGSRYVVTNYAMWLSASEFLNKSAVLIMDEAHNAPGHLDAFLETDVDFRELSEVLGRELLPPRNWNEWLRVIQREVKSLVKEGIASPFTSIKKLKRLVKVTRVLDSLARTIDTPAVAEKIGDIYRLNPVYLDQYAEPLLFRGIDNVLLTSATVTEHTAKVLGIKKYAYREFPSAFPIANRPVIYLPTVKMDRRTTRADEALWFSRIEAILKGRRDRKGIIHSVSYDRAKTIAKTGHPVMLHTTKNTAIAVRKFKHSKPPMVLISPAMTTGWDFPYDECEFQIIAKVPFPDGRSQINQVRARLDPDFPMHKAWQGIVQAAGRGVRAVDDRCETLIIDDNFKWLLGRYGHLAPTWFRQAIIKVQVLPTPPEKINGRRR